MTRSEPEPNPDPALQPAPEREPGGSVLAGASRRAFIAGAGAATVAGAAAVAAGPLVAGAAGAAAAAPVPTSGEDAASGRGGPAVVAYVRDLDSGEVRLMSGEREVVVRDRALARTLARHVDARLDNKEG
jgi:hypothetical protein